MVTSEYSVVINRRLEEVFNYLSDLQNGKQWQTGVVDVQRLSPGAPGAGSRYVVVRKFLGRKMESNVEISVFEPNRKMVLKSTSGPMPFEQTILFQPAGEGTRVSSVIDLQGTGVMGMAEPMIAGSVKREVIAAFGDLKDLMEHKVPEAQT
jgi:carbon monoxide dehydrogenase subunit G